MVEVGKPASELAKVFSPCPQLLKNVRFTVDKAPLETVTVKAAIKDAEASLLGKGRLLIRKSGTEPLIRVMVEAEDQALLLQVIEDVAQAVQDVA
jgi:phosphoglucosamine mutase